MDAERFTRQVTAVLAQRAGNICSNPDCSALTSGPAEDDARAINVGEAAHIYGARPGSARFDSARSDAARGDITNAIWLCRNCHKMVDADPARFQAGLLFEWRRAHEHTIMDSLGKAGALRERALQRGLKEFDSCSYLAQQIIIDKPAHWEYKLTAEILTSLLFPIKLRWEALEKGLYAHPKIFISYDDYLNWFRTRIQEMEAQVHALAGLVNGEIQRSWGPAAEPGSEQEIYRICALISEACQRILEWEENVRFVAVPDLFDEIHQLLVGVAGVFIHKTFEMPIWLTDIFSAEDPSGTHTLELVFELPDDWPERIERAIKRVERRMR